VWTHDEILAELIRRKSEGRLRNRDVSAWLGLPSSAVSNIFSGSRRIQQNEMPVLFSKLWLDDEVASESGFDAQLLTLSLSPLLSAAGLDRVKSLKILELLPDILAEARSAAAKGMDPATAADTAARLLWQSARVR
jgi:hypothetical protein